MTRRIVAGVDSSTSATKVELRDLDTGEVISRASSPHPPTTPPRSEQPPDSWWAAFAGAWEQLASGQVDPELDPDDVASISVAGQQHGLVVLDDHDRVVRPAKLWNDTESAPDAGDLVAALEGGRQGWAEACGSVPVASFTITKLAWLRRCEPESWERLARVLLPHDWLTFQLCGRRVTDRGDASGTGYWSGATGRWRTDLLDLVDDSRDWDAALPEVLGPNAAAGAWNGTVVAPGTGDNMAGALGVALRPRDVAISIGTSGTVYTVSEAPTADPSGRVAGFADATGNHLPLVCTLNATKVTNAVRSLLGVGLGEFDALALGAPPGAGGLTLLPYFDGERTPDRPDATGVLAGLRSDVGREQLARAAVEGVVCGLLDGLDALGEFAPVDGRLMLVGGGARSAAFRQITADLTGRAVQVPDDDEQVAAGACAQAAAVAGGEPPADVAARWGLGVGETVEPSAASAAADDVRAAYATLRDAT